MTDDIFPTLNRLMPKEDGEPAVKYRKGIVAGVGSGVVDVLLSGVVIPDVPIHGTASISDEVHLLVWTGDLLAIGECGGGGGGCGSCNLGDLLNVDTTGQAQGDMLYYNGSNWVLVGGTKATGRVPTIQGSGAIAWQAGGGGGGAIEWGMPDNSIGGTAGVVPGHPLVGVTTVTGTVGLLIYIPLLVQESLDVASLVGECTGGQGAGRELRVGLYESDWDWTPGDLVFEGAFDAASTGVKTVAAPGGSVIIPQGRYLLARRSNHATPSWRAWQINLPFGVTGTNGLLRFLTISGQPGGALPDPGTAWDTFTTGTIPTTPTQLLVLNP